MENSRIALITGATSGLGQAVACALAEQGMHVLLHGRDRERTANAADQIQASGGSVQTYLADLSSLRETRDLAEQVSAEHPVIHLLINNAGIGPGRPPYRKRILSADGYELRFAVNYLAPVLLARKLVPALNTGAPARIVNVASAGQAPIDFADLRMDHHYTGTRAYYRSKFALVAFTFDFAAQLSDTAITVNCLHPASLMNTRMVRQAWIPPVSSVSTGVKAVMNLAVEPVGAAVTGRYFDGCREAKAHRAAYDPAIQSRLRAVTDEILQPFLSSKSPK
ncbi:SDR family NAD(P)-dependent oxidoreductase [Mycobacterium xenopi]|uniref:3-oxoacyl-ACP reductase n=1 Tax=Mycobacterium xenopi TaxID=1789 RepID=A0AAD1M130_MYCXE|nr:SDR family NAD(P)-dependent oxidoreductase [Mycobacterium xenopi]MDA3641781.1 SDR family NAD(P)-dependent oxidoreductase [Mycobacterium xenopi]MDA3659885.1 SDR family NAD(P)-dependent oxidoreductase [Mycobacterium xenopi]MDA3664004.1 SDR family NAD(P)-dependent oxidoreductase [Mycobacterium xenopi]ORX21054.1 3-oxoacyl-ACP reductase [Mycobacterium xenopi]SPX92626.1 short-chain dehydrogenase [Mycobacterium xenopi]